MELPKALAQRLSHSPVPKDDNALYGKLLPSKLRKLLGIEKLQAKREIDNVIIKNLLVRKESTTQSTSVSPTNQIGSK